MKTYIETDLLNDNYIYTYENNNIIVHSNCNNNQCDCVNIYPELDYMRSNIYSCILQNNNNIIDYSKLTDNYYYRIDFYKILIIFIIFCFFIIYCPIKILLRFFKRFN